MATSPICSVDGCDKPSRRAGYCAAHHHRKLRYGHPLAGAAPRIRNHGGTCSVDGCSRPYYGRGYCESHWYRSHAYSDISAGRTIRGSISEYLETVVLTYSGDECLTWPFARSEHGYARANIGGKQYKVSRYVCTNVHGEPPTSDSQAAHSCGKGHEGCVNPNHLSWKTPLENAADKLRHGTVSRGEKHPRSKLTTEQVLAIRGMAGKASNEEIGRIFGVRGYAIGRIIKRERWGHV